MEFLWSYLILMVVIAIILVLVLINIRKIIPPWKRGGMFFGRNKEKDE